MRKNKDGTPIPYQIGGGIILRVGEQYGDFRRDEDTLKMVRYLGMPSNDRFAMQFSLKDENSFTAFYPVTQNQIEFSGYGETGRMDYVFSVSRAREEGIGISTIHSTFFEYEKRSSELESH